MSYSTLFTRLIITIVFQLSVTSAYAQGFGIEWQKSYGGTGYDGLNTIKATADGGYIMACYSESVDGDVTANKGDLDFWVVKMTDRGIIQWQRSYGGSGYDYPISIIPGRTGYLVVGETWSNGGDVTGTHLGIGDAWILKLNDAGAIEWQDRLGGSNWDFANKADTTSDGGFIVTGGTFSKNGNFVNVIEPADIWVAKYKSYGARDWLKIYGHTTSDYGFDVHQTKDGGYIVAAGSGANGGDGLLLKLGKAGQLEWERLYGGYAYEQAIAVHETNDGYIIGCSTSSTNGQLTSNHGKLDYWVIKTDNTGALVWQKTYGGSENDKIGFLEKSPGGGYILTGYTASNDGDISFNHGGVDVWVVKIDDLGAIEWQETLGSSSDDSSFSIGPNPDGSYLVGCVATMANGDVSINKGNEDAWLVKLKSNPLSVKQLETADAGIKVYPTVFGNSIHIELPIGYNNAAIHIYNMQGQLIPFNLKGSAIHRELQIDNIASGMYILEVTGNGEKNSYKLICK